MTKKQVTELITKGKPALENAMVITEIADRLARLGYDQAKLSEGLALCTQVEAEYYNQHESYKHKNNRSDSVAEAREAATKTYVRIRNRAKTALEDYPDQYELVGLNDRRKTNYKQLREQAIYFYNRTLENPPILLNLAEFKIIQTDLEAGLALFDTADQADKQRLISTGTAQQSTKDRNELAIEFESWLRNFWKIAEVATADKPQLLEQLGRVVA